MRLKDALELAHKVCWHVWCVKLVNPDSDIEEINCVHHCWNDIHGDEHFADFLYYTNGLKDFQHVSFQIPAEESLDLTKFPGLNMEEKGWTWADNTENMLKEGFYDLALIVAKFARDNKNTGRKLWFVQESIDALKTFCNVD